MGLPELAIATQSWSSRGWFLISVCLCLSPNLLTNAGEASASWNLFAGPIICIVLLLTMQMGGLTRIWSFEMPGSDASDNRQGLRLR
ncbi:hypothetical protein QBC37DRAFT_411297 [Rhypophila decipiens]|uniref:Uncharacterized protein n=1 Tax=Rhypophila decipiens TaxID=261697 RepID=A0AAN6YL48_9PEZI|nr:hypothetical protein QBC37DRAFT_411297 [Rhypophila decipiens]